MPLNPFGELAACGSTAELESHPVYRKYQPVIERVLGAVETGGRGRGGPARGRYRFVAWNIERGAEIDAQIEALRSDPYLREADVLLITEADMGMARSGNREVAQEMASALGMYYAFSPCYLNLVKGSGVEYEVEGENALGLHGNAILSRYPLRNPRSIVLQNGIDKMRGREKRIGSQKAVAACIGFPEKEITAVAMHLDAHSTQGHRRKQMREVLAALEPGIPAVLGGDWNTSTYNSSHAFYAILGFCVRVLMGVEHVIRNHYLHPYRWFERALFRELEHNGFDFRNANLLGEPLGLLRHRRREGHAQPGRVGAGLVFRLHPLGTATPRWALPSAAGLVRHPRRARRNAPGGARPRSLRPRPDRGGYPGLSRDANNGSSTPANGLAAAPEQY